MPRSNDGGVSPRGLGTEPAQVFVSGRLIDAEVLASALRAHDIYCEVWNTGLGPWHRASALPEITRVPNEFGAHRVMVRREEEEAALELIESFEHSDDSSPGPG